MNTQEIINDDRMVDMTEEIAEKASNGSWKIAAGAVLVGAVGMTAYLYIAKPLINKIKSKRGNRTSTIKPVCADDNIESSVETQNEN